MSSAFEATLGMRGTRLWPTLAACAVAAVGVTGASVDSSSVLSGVSAVVAVVAIFAAAVSHAWNRWQTLRTVAVRADATGLFFDGALVAPRARITDARYLPASEEALEQRVVLRLRGGRRYVLVTDDPAVARRLLEALGMDPARKRVSFRASSLVMNNGLVAFVFFGALTVATVAATELPGAAWLVPLVLGIVLTLAPRRVTVGADGVVLSWLGLSRFVPYARIRCTTAGPAGLEVHLEGERRPLFVRTAGMREASDTVRRGWLLDHAYTIAERIDEAHRAYLLARAAEDAAVLEPPRRDVAAWVARMRLLGRGEGAGYRASAVSVETLWRIAENQGVGAGARAGAILALARSLDDAGRERMRVAVDAVAEPRVRVALETAAEGSDEAVERAVSDLARGDASAGR